MGRSRLINYYSNNKLATATFLWQLREQRSGQQSYPTQIGQSQCTIQFNNVLAAESSFIRKTYLQQLLQTA